MTDQVGRGSGQTGVEQRLHITIVWVIMVKPLFAKLLVANRGEIACRVMRTAKALGIGTVAVYSSADAKARHVQMADEAYLIGEATAQQSYLKVENILDAVMKSGAAAVHPGYGFLSENARFAEQCKQNGVVFVGPPSSAITAMGSKSESKRIMVAANVPTVPGYHQDDQSIELLRAEAEKIGYPVLIKAVMGGGGKGMKIATSSKDFITQLDSAKRESLKAFGDDRVILEKYVTSSRHIEVQVFCDTFGRAVYLYERDCSVQRRHQKVIEEAPSLLSPEKRTEIGLSATRAAKAVGYVNAGTVEFLYDEDAKTHYFMEMNTRLQVEHPVTEAVTGLDLVEWQLKVAAGLPLPLKQEEIRLDGFAAEARVYAEDPYRGFLPSTGKLWHVEFPSNARVDTGVGQGDEISMFYDPMIAKVITWGPNRPSALQNLYSALHEFRVAGVRTNISFLKRLLHNSAFVSGDFNTSLIPNHADTLLVAPEFQAKHLAQLAICVGEWERRNLGSGEAYGKTHQLSGSPWFTAHGFRLNAADVKKVAWEVDGQVREAEVEVGLSRTLVRVQDASFEAKATSLGDGNFRVTLDQASETVTLVKTATGYWFLTSDGESFEVKTVVKAAQSAKAAVAEKLVKSPIPGKLIKMDLKEGDEVEAGAVLVVLESMKMEHMIRAAASGRIVKIHKSAGEFVSAGDLLIEF